MVGLRFKVGFLALAAVAMVGCGGGDQAATPAGAETAATEENAGGNKHAAPESLAAAAKMLAEQRDQLAAGYEADDVKAVDGTVHDMFHAASSIESLVTESSLDRYDANTATDAGKQILEVLNALHDGMHGSDAKLDAEVYGKEVDSLNDAINNLQAMAEKAGPEQPGAGETDAE